MAAIPPLSPVALVTGASGALGSVVAACLAARGFRLGLHCHTGTEAAEALAASLAVDTVVASADLGEWDATERLAATVTDRLGPIGVLVHCAAVRQDGLLMAQRPDVWSETIRVNLLGTYHANRAVIGPMVKARSGRVINVVTPSALFGNAGQTAYSASKAGVIGLTRSLAKEVGGRGVTVNALAPGYMDTALTADVPEAAAQRLLDRSALGRPGQPTEMVPGITFLLDAGYVTGQVIAIDGGMTP